MAYVEEYDGPELASVSIRTLCAAACTGLPAPCGQACMHAMHARSVQGARCVLLVSCHALMHARVVGLPSRSMPVHPLTTPAAAYVAVLRQEQQPAWCVRRSCQQ